MPYCICGHPSEAEPRDDLASLNAALDDIRERRRSIALEAVDDPRVLDELPDLKAQEDELLTKIHKIAFT